MIRVLVVDDSAVVRKVLTQELNKEPDIEVVGAAMDPYVAREMLVKLDPDVLTLDLEMPRMDGLTFLQKLMRHYPKPVVVVSSLTPANSPTALRALELGAVEVISKPGSAYTVPEVAGHLARAIRAAARAKLHVQQRAAEAPAPVETAKLLQTTTHKLVAIGASTGGTRAIEDILRRMPANIPGTVIVQHMPKNFTRPFAERLDGLCRMEVREAKAGDAVVPGVVLIAPGDRHMRLRRSGARYFVTLHEDPPVHFQRPAVDPLFESVAEVAGANAVGVILTGMGRDGAAGLLKMKEAGAHTIAQDEKTSVVWGMPGAAVELGAAEEVLPLDRIPKAILESRVLREQEAPAPA